LSVAVDHVSCTDEELCGVAEAEPGALGATESPPLAI
jgi:hypothetical protein